MKEFFKYVLATIVGFICVTAFMGIMSLIMFFSIMATSDTQPTVSDGSVLRIELNGTVSERVTENPFAELMGNKALASQGLDDLLKAIKVAKTNDKIKGIYLEGGLLSADFASLEELRKALVDFKQSKKFVVAYADQYTQGSYYLASAADKVWLNPSGMLDWHGIASQPIFFTDLMKKVGVKMQVFKVGTFKSAVEPYILTEMSEPNRQQVQSFIGDIWQHFCQDVSASRKISTDSLNAFADRYVTFAEANDYVRLKMVDELTYIDQVRTKLQKLSQQDKVNFISPAELAKLDVPASSSNDIAIYYAEGTIVDVSTQSPLNSTQSEIVGSKVVSDLDKLAKDESVKAVVLRINSGGGSAYASEQMWRAVQQLKAKKPVVVSMSGMAASGGYYLSCGADYIVADKTTLTGSIGIFGMVPDASELLTDKLGLHFDVVKTNVSSDFGAMGRGFNAAESAAMQNYVNRGYRLFLKRVADGRKMTPEQVDKIAQGRVWTGNQALKIKLVDKLGTLNDAVAEAAKRAKLQDYAICTFPAKTPWFEQLMNETTQRDYLEEKLQSALGVYYEPLRFVSTYDKHNVLQARMFYVPNFQ
ncbi:signal peptide peptidase SppA 67K type [Prevotella sp. CAG:891]|nr:signal peptide peptidase SppA [Prevotellamassilia sp.]CDE86203.1 signal peptide peptidase SppA 67K type [Prevotella sp. CAG:891]